MKEEILEIRQGEYYARLPRRVFSQEVIAKILQIFVDLDEKYPKENKK